MKLARLTDFGIPERFIARWRETIGEDLLDWQADAVRQHDLFGSFDSLRPGSGQAAQDKNGSVIVIAPTSSGKTFLAEMAAAASLVRRRKVVYIAPLKALVAQKHERFREVFASPPLGFRVAVSTRDQRTADGRLRKGEFDIAITVYEKFHALILSHLDLLSTIDLVILDEPQLLGDPKRGPVVAAICDTLASVSKPPRILMLASHLPEADVLSRYLHAPILHVQRRPVELRLGVLQGGHFHFREHNSTEVGDETFPWNDRLPESERPLAMLGELAAQGERILVFCPSKTDCHKRAAALAEWGSTSLTTSGLELTENELWQIQSGPSLASHLAQWIARGVAVHHADLTPHQRTLIESLFAQGRIAVLFCTGTLAWGVHLPATAVFVDAEKFTGGPYAGRVVPVPLARLEFEGMAGRAGRLGLDSKMVRPGSPQVGRGVLWSHNECEAELLWDAYIAPTRIPHPTLSQREREQKFPHPGPLPEGAKAFPVERRLLDWVVCGLARTLDDVVALAERSPFESKESGGLSFSPLGEDVADALFASATERGVGNEHPSPVLRQRAAQNHLPHRGRIEAWHFTLARLLRAELIVADSEGRLSSTPRGTIAAASGLSVETTIAITRALHAASDFDPALWIALFTSLPETSDARLFHSVRNTRDVSAAWVNRFSEDFLTALARRFAHDPQVATGAFPNASAQARAMMTALVLDDWMHGVATRELEHRYRLPIGRLEPVADTLSWIFETTSSLAATAPQTSRFANDFERAAFRIRHGVPESASNLVQALGGLLPRQTILDLIARGWDDPAMLASREPMDCVGLAPMAVMEKAIKRCRKWNAECGVRNSELKARAENPYNTNVSAASGTQGAEHFQSAIRIPQSAFAEEASMSPILQLDGAAHRARMSVQLAGHTVMLRAKSFKYLLALAAARMLTRDGWIAKTEIEPGENQIKYFYQLRRELRAAGRAADTLIENDGNGRYRLALPPQAIRFDLARLAEHADWDIRSRAGQLVQAAQQAA